MRRLDDIIDVGLILLLALFALLASDPGARAAYTSAVVVIGVLR